ncbi:hypothetical protein QOT17_015758 [Balamuthia mandrillaris]
MVMVKGRRMENAIQQAKRKESISHHKKEGAPKRDVVLRLPRFWPLLRVQHTQQCAGHHEVQPTSPIYKHKKTIGESCGFDRTKEASITCMVNDISNFGEK